MLLLCVRCDTKEQVVLLITRPTDLYWPNILTLCQLTREFITVFFSPALGEHLKYANHNISHEGLLDFISFILASFLCSNVNIFDNFYRQSASHIEIKTLVGISQYDLSR